MNDRSIKHLGYWLVLIASFIIIGFLIQRPRDIIKELQKEQESIKAQSQKTIDSLNDIYSHKEDEFIKKIVKLQRQRDSITALYDISQSELDEITQSIGVYLNATDSERFAKFKHLLTQVD